MTNPVQPFSAPAWQHLNNQLKTAVHPSQADHLPAVSPNPAQWAAFISSPAEVQPYQQHLSESLSAIRDFIQANAVNGIKKQSALGMLADFVSTKVACKASNLNPLMVNENRRNLHLIATQLKNPAIPLEHRIGMALALPEGLNVCKEGLSLNILNCAANLVHAQQGFTGVIIQTKNELIDQHLLELVRQQDAMHLSPKLAKSFEIHHVQALKNHVAQQWGLAAVADRYATASYQQQAGDMAKALLEQTITPRRLAETIAENLCSSLTSLTDNTLKTGMPTELLKTEPLRQALQAQFGQEVDLEHCLEFNEDYSEVRLKPLTELTLHVLHLFKNCGLVPTETPVEHLMAQAAPSIEQALSNTAVLQGPASSQGSRRPIWNLAFWFGIDIVTKQQSQDDRERKKQPTA